MAAINFPSSPSNGDTHVVDGVTYTYNSAETKWKTTINSNAFLPLSGGTLSGNLTVGGVTYPTSDGTTGQYIQTDGSGTLSFATVEGLPDAIDVNASAPADSISIDASGRLLVNTTSSVSTNCFFQSLGNPANNAGTEIYLGRNEAATKPLSAGNSIATIRFGDNAGANFASIHADVDGATGSNDYPGRLSFHTTKNAASTQSERVRIDNFGTFKASNCQSSTTFLNTSSTGTFNEIRTDINDQWVAVLSHATGGNPYGLNIYYQNTNPNNTASQFIYCNSTNGVKFEVYSNGGISNYQSNNSNLCDEREKKNIVDLDSTWDCLKQWELKKFHYNEDADTDNKRYGVIAQQVAQHCPEVIADWVKQKAEDAVLDDDGNVVTPAKEEIVRMGVKEQQMMWMAIKALQEAQTRIEQLETRVAQLEGGTN